MSAHQTTSSSVTWSGFYIEDAVNYQVVQEPVEGRNAIREVFAQEFGRANGAEIVTLRLPISGWSLH